MSNTNPQYVQPVSCHLNNQRNFLNISVIITTVMLASVNQFQQSLYHVNYCDQIIPFIIRAFHDKQRPKVGKFHLYYGSQTMGFSEQPIVENFA